MSLRISHWIWRGVDLMDLGSLLNWGARFLGYLTFPIRNEDIFVALHHASSDVPPRNALGPILLVIHISVISGDIQSSFDLFVEDLKIYWSLMGSACDFHFIESDRDPLWNWSNLWRLNVRHDKYSFVLFNYLLLLLFLRAWQSGYLFLLYDLDFFIGFEFSLNTAVFLRW